MIKLFKHIFLDVSLLYKNFFHWNISKVFIIVYTFLTAIIFQLPFAIVTLGIIYFGSIDWVLLGEQFSAGVLGLDLITMITERPFLYLVLFVFLFLQASVFYITLLYSKVLFSKLYLKYQNGKKLKFFKDYSFTSKKIVLWIIFILFVPVFGLYFFLRKMFGEHEKNVLKFFQITGWNILYLLIPIFVFLIPFFLLVSSIGDFEKLSIMLSDQPMNYFTIISFALFVFAAILFICISVRIYFSYIIFADHKNYSNDKKALFYVKESIKLTKGFKKIIKLVPIIIVFSIILFPIFEITSSYFEAKQSNTLNYVEYRNASQEGRQQLLKEDQYDYRSLILEFENVDNETLNRSLMSYYICIVILQLLYFFVIYKVIEMVLVSFYRRELIK
ncbi:hypothetical protein A9Q91_04465 [Candidatus Gracilibacteria bacterium 28_42_T64]|nr:hypothetical protein A9Q91_04465 [Candidatus Gracilibacteria bacterium 28_42_T64]